MLLKDRVAIITGAGRGIGRETAIDFAREGANVVLVSRSEKELSEVASEVEKLGTSALVATCDIAMEEEVKKVFEKAVSCFGRVDIVVANAGIHLRKPVIETTTEEWDEMMAINLRGTFLYCREAAKIMIEQNYGKIIIVSSESGKKGSAFQGAYCTSKFGQIGFTEVLQDELKDYNINVNAVLPSATNTKLLRDSYPEVNHSLLLKPEQIAKVITFVASDNASGVKGASYEVWGAQNMRPNLFNT
jgi:NAD(P)-dependent dehydrogenase (short-subunit alcohol dehydrogenase family)